MPRTQVLSLLNNYKKNLFFFPEEAGNFDLMYNFVCHEPECLDKDHRAGHITTSSFVLTYSLDAVLLMHHKKIDKWLLIGGHTDGEGNLLEAALKQVRIESGISGIMPVRTSIFDIDAHIVPERKNEPEHWHFDIRFLLKAPKNARYLGNNEAQVLKWVRLDEIHKYSDELSVLRMADKVKLLHIS